MVMFYFSRQLHYCFVFYIKKAVQVNINFINIEAVAVSSLINFLVTKRNI